MDQSSISAPKKWYWAYYLPILNWGSKYELKALPGDLCAGVTLASFQIPISLSYATSLAGVDPTCGLYGLIIAPLVYACLGTVPTMVVAPEGPISLIIGKIKTAYFTDLVYNFMDSQQRSKLDTQQISSLISAICGGLILAFGLMRIGFLASIISQSVLRGFITGVGLVIIADQFPSMLGLGAKMHEELGAETSCYQKLKFTFANWGSKNNVDTWFSFLALAGIIGFKLLKNVLIRKMNIRKAVLIPDILIVVVISTIASYLGQFKDLDIVGEVNANNVEYTWMIKPQYWPDFKTNFQSAFIIGILGLLESTIAARLLNYEPSSSSANREMVALGAANVFGSLFSSLPSFGGYGKSKINELCGATTQMSGVIAATLSLICVKFLMKLVYYLPKCTLSAIVLSIGLNLLFEAPHELKFFWKVRSFTDLFTLFMITVTTFFWSVQAGVTLGITVAIFRVIHHATRPRIQILARNSMNNDLINADEIDGIDGELDNLSRSGILVIYIPEPLTFANSNVLESRLRRIELHGTTRVHPGMPASLEEPVRLVIFQLKGMTKLDASAASVLYNIIHNYLNQSIKVLFAELPPSFELHKMLRNSGIFEMLETQHGRCIYDNVAQVLEDYT